MVKNRSGYFFVVNSPFYHCELWIQEQGVPKCSQAHITDYTKDQIRENGISSRLSTKTLVTVHPTILDKLVDHALLLNKESEQDKEAFSHIFLNFEGLKLHKIILR